MKGFPILTDMGIARYWCPDNMNDTSGTPSYMGNGDNIAPEVLSHQNHGVAVDFYALGVMTYEFMMGHV
jgi:serine/threonine protein kinase